MDKSKAFTYSVRMKTPIGIKKGTMTVLRDGKKICGELNILSHCEPFEGSIAEDGSCVLSGTIVTLIRMIHYRATGIITADELKLFVADGNNLFEITGIKE